MKITTKTILLLLLVVILSFTMIACSRQKENLPPIPEDTSGPVSPVINVNKNELMKKISRGMIISEDRLEGIEDKFVSSEYTVHTGYINYTVDYKANYASKRQNSEIYVKVFDNNYHMNRLFVYYNKGDLYIQSQDEKKSIKGFGSTSMFDLFYEMIIMFDMSDTFISSEMSALFDPDNVGANIGTLVDQSRMKYIKVTDTAESIEMTDVNLNYGQIKQQVNNMIKDTFDKYERKFDLLSMKYLGLRISDLAVLEISTMVGDLINIRLNNSGVETVIFEASGNMADGINTFTVELEVSTKAGKGTIKMDPTENPFLNNYPEMIMGRFNYGGTLFVPFFDMTYDAKLQAILSSTDNTVNQVVFTIDSINEEMGGLFYKDQMLYVDISGMSKQLNGAIQLEKLNLPKVKFDGIDLAQEITLLINDVLKIVQSASGEDEYGENEELLQLVLDNIDSDEKTNIMSIRITKELIEQLYGEDVDLVQLLAQKLEVSPEVLAQILGDNALENAVLILSYNVENGDIGLDLFDDNFLIFELRLSKLDSLLSDTLTYPSSFNPDYFYWLEIPDNTILSIEGSLSMQEVSKVQFDKFFGALFGDITGLNTPYTLLSSEQLNFTVDIMQVFDYFENAQGQTERIIDQVMKIEIFKKGVLQIGIYSSSDPDYILVHFNVPIGPNGVDRNGVPYTQRTLKYKIERQKVKDGFDELLGEDNIFGMENIMDVLSKLLKSVRDSQSMQLRFVDSSLAFNLISDSVEEIIGIGNLNALIKARVKFATTPEEYLNINMQESQFVTPNIRPLENKTFESIYTTQWHEFVYTYFGDDLMRLKLSFTEDSVKIVSGKYYYQPRAKLLDEIVSYYVTIQDELYGIKIVSAVLDPDMPKNKDAVLSAARPLSIDPSISAVLPDRLPVLYDDGTFGYVNYIIESFDVSNITISGMPRDEFWLVIGKGSVAEKRFYISVQVLGRVILPMQEIIQGQLVYMISNIGEPVVAEVTIDPYTYAIRKSENPLWSPLPRTLNLKFESLEGLTVGDIVAINNINWDFNFNNIQYNGGVFFSHAMYNNLTIALKVNVKSKIVSYLRFVDSVNTSLPIDNRPYTEAIGSYTVDVLETSSYTFPTGSTSKQELRLYYKDGTYRIIGTRDHNQDDVNFYQNYLPLVLQWKHPTIDYSTLKLVGTKAPLGTVDKNINTTVIGSDSFSIGSQGIGLSVLMPSRAEATIGNASSIFAITGYGRLGDGSYNFAAPIREMTTFTNASFDKDNVLGSFFEFNPYNQKPLPSMVYLDVIQGGETRTQRKGYAVQWVESDVLMARHTYDGTGSIIHTDYILRYVSTDEEHLLVTGILGEGNHTIQVKMIIVNIDAIYQDITYEGMDTNVTQKIVDPYINYSIPSYYTLMLRNGNEIQVNNVEWFIELQSGKNWMLQLDGRSYHWIYDYIDYLEDVKQGTATVTLNEVIPYGFSEPTEEELNYFLLLIEKGEIPFDNRFVFTNQGGNYVIKSYIDATDSVISQEVFLTINVMPRTVLFTDVINGYNQLDLYNQTGSTPMEQYILDTYDAPSDLMLSRLQYLLSMNEVYDNTIRAINNILSDLRKNPANSTLDNITINALCYEEYFYRSSTSEKNVLTVHYNAIYNANPNASTEEIKFYALQSYIQQKNNNLSVASIGVYFGDNPDTSTQKYNLNVRWINLEEIISTLESSDGAVLGIVLEGYIGYGQINQQLVRIPFRIARREIVSIRFNRMTGYDAGAMREEVRNGVYYYYQINQGDNVSVMSVDYRYAYIADENEATSLIYSIMDAVILDNSILQHQKSITIFTRLYEHISTTEADRFIMESVEEKIENQDSEIRYSQIIDEIIRLRQQNIRSIFIDMNKPLGLVKFDSTGKRVFIEPSEHFQYALSQVSLVFADGTEGYYNPRYNIGAGQTLSAQKLNFDKKLLATDPTVYEIAIDPETGLTYAYVSVLLTHLSDGSCRYPITVRFKAILDEKGVVDGYPSESEIEPFDENGNPRFIQGYNLPQNITIVYDKSGPVTFGNINNWILASPLAGFNEGDLINNIPITSINIINPSIIDFRINLPCQQGEYTYHVNFPQKYIGKVKYNAQAQDRNFSTLDINSGIIEIDNIYEIYDSTKSIGFDTSKLPQKINPYNYEYGDVQYDFQGIVIDTFYSVTTSNSFDIEWKIVDEWINKRIDHNGTAVERNGELVVEPVLFATAKIFSYYILPQAFGFADEVSSILFEQEIELYIKVKPLANPVIVYDGLVDYENNNSIEFDPYDDSNNYGGNLVLPKEGLKVYFNNNMQDVFLFDARASLKYFLLMADSDDIAKAHLYDALMDRTNTSEAEKFGYHKEHINRIIATYAERAGISIGQANENLLSAAFNSLLNAGNLTISERQNQRQFLIDFSIKLFENHYGLSSLKAWQKLIQQNTTDAARAIIVSDYLYDIQSLDEGELLEDLQAMFLGYQEMLNRATNTQKETIVSILTASFSNAKKAIIIDILDRRELFVNERGIALNNIFQEGGISDATLRKAEVFNRIIQMVSPNNKLEIIKIGIEEEEYTQIVALAQGLTAEEAAKSILFRNIAIAVQNRTDLMDVLSISLASTIVNWTVQNDNTAARMWEIYLNRMIEKGNYQNILNLVELYMSCSENNSIARLKNIAVNQLINVYDYNPTEMGVYFTSSSQEVAERILNTIVVSASAQLEGWQIRRAKAEVWDYIGAGLQNETILNRILNGESSGIGSIDTITIRALAYERLKQSDYLSIFQISLSELEATIINSDQEQRRAAIFKMLYDESTLSEKVLLIEMMMGAARNISHTQKEVSAIEYTQSGHSIIEIRENMLFLYLLLPDGQRIELSLDIFSREIRDVMVPNIITNIDGEEILADIVAIPNIYYIDPYNSETFRLPQQAEFVFETGHNLVLDITEWVDYDGNIFYTRSQDEQNNVFYYNLTQNSYRGGSYVLNSYLTYGTGETAERQPFSITVILLNRTLKDAYEEKYHFDNPISGRMKDIPASLTNDMFVEFDVYYKSLIPPEFFYSNFGTPVVPQINWEKVSYNQNGLSDSDILVTGGFEKNVQGFLYYDNKLLTNTYNQLWKSIFDEYATITKPIAWERFFETMVSGERIVKTLFAGAAAVQIKALDDQIYRDMYIQAYITTYETTNVDIREKMNNLMITFRNNNFGLITDDTSTEWYIFFYKDLQEKAKTSTLSAVETEVWNALYSAYVTQEVSTINARRASKWDELFAMTGIWQGQQQDYATAYLNEAYKIYRNFMLSVTWDNLEKLARENEAAVMTQIIDTLRLIYGTTEQAKIRAWDFLKNDDRIKGISGETAQVKITAESWSILDIMNMAGDIINEITFNAFTKTTNESQYQANFEIINTLITERLREILEQLTFDYYDEYRKEALEQLEEIIEERILQELKEIIFEDHIKLEKWDDLIAKRTQEAVSPIDNTRASVEADNVDLDNYERDMIVWSRLLEGAGDWLDIMVEIYMGINANPEYTREHLAVEAYRARRIDVYTQDMQDAYDFAYYSESLAAWNTVYSSPSAYGETLENIENILLKDVKQEAWMLVYNNYATSTDISIMDSSLNISDGALMYSRGWNRYYYNTTFQRKEIMDKVLLYFYGYDKENDNYVGYNKVYQDILQNPEAFGETPQSLASLYSLISDQLSISDPIFIQIEMVSRLHNYSDEVQDLYDGYVDSLRRDAWVYLLERRLNAPIFTNLLPESTLKPLAWDVLRNKRVDAINEEFAVIDSLFYQVVMEKIEEIKRQAYTIVYNEASSANKNILVNFYNSTNREDARNILWNRLYERVSDAEKTAMNVTYNTILREGGIPGLNAESRSWERFSAKTETSAALKSIMSQMLYNYLRSKAYDEYEQWVYDTDCVSYELNIINYYVESYRKAQAWNDIYAGLEEGSPRQDEMDTILLEMYALYNGMGYEQELIKAFALDSFIASLEDQAERDIMTGIISSTQIQYKYPLEIRDYKITEWDFFYTDTFKRSAMDDVLILYGYNKAVALDSTEFRNILLPQERQDLDNRIESKINDLLELFFIEKAYDKIFENPVYSAGLQQLYNAAQTRYIILYNNGDVSQKVLKREAIKMHLGQNLKNAEGYFKGIIDNIIIANTSDYKALTWDKYYELSVQEDTERAELMMQILHNSVSAEITTLQLDAINYLYNELQTEAAEKVITTRENLYESIKKNAVWTENFGESIYSLKSILNNILPVEQNQKTIKDLAWIQMMELLSTRIEYINSMIITKNSILNAFPSYSDNQVDTASWDELFTAIADQNLRSLMSSIISQYEGFEEQSKHLAWRQLGLLLQNEENTFNIMSTIKMVVYGENPTLAGKDLNQQAYDRVVELYPNIADRIETDFVYHIKSEAFDALVVHFNGNDIISKLIVEMYNLELFYHNNNVSESKAVCWNRFVSMTESIENNLTAVDPRYSEDELRAFALDRVLDMLSGAERVVLENAVEDMIIEVAEAKSEVWKNTFFVEDEDFVTIINNIIYSVSGDQETIKDGAWKEFMDMMAISIGYLQLMHDTRAIVAIEKPTYDEEQLDYASWQKLYFEGDEEIVKILEDIRFEYNYGSESLHLAWRKVMEIFQEDSDTYDLLDAVKTGIIIEYPASIPEEINYFSYDRAQNLYPAIGVRLNEQYEYEYDRLCWESLKAVYSQSIVMNFIFNSSDYYHRMNNFYDRKEVVSLCWNEILNVSNIIEDTLLNADPSLTQEELNILAINCVLNNLNFYSRSQLLQEIKDTSIILTSKLIDSQVYDILYSRSVQQQKLILATLLTEAEEITETQDIVENKAKAIELYIQYKKTEAVSTINEEAQRLFSKGFKELNVNEKLSLYLQLHQAKTSENLIFYTITEAEKYWNNRNTDSIYGRMSIMWDQEVLEQGGDIARVFIGNAYKAYDNGEGEFLYEENTFIKNNFLYKNRQIIVEKLDFYGSLNILAGDVVIDTRSYYNELVIDPLNPFIPTQADAYGFITDVVPNVDINGVMYTYIGKVNVSFENRIYEFLYDEEGSAGEDITAVASPGLGEGAQNINIKVYYLNRQPIMYYANSQNYTIEQRDESLNLYPLSIDNIGGNKVMTVDPLNESIYNTITKAYALPSSLVAMFTDSYADGIIATLFMNNIFSNRLDISNIAWNMQGTSISLQGLPATNISINAYEAGGISRTSSSQMNLSFWKIQLHVLSRNAERVLEVNQQGLGGSVLSSMQTGVLQATTKIDPYNIMASFPSNVRVEFIGGGDSKLLTNITWQFAEGRGLEYLKLPEVITGSIGESAMFITAGFTCVSETIWINFPIQTRHIDISVDGSDEIRYLEGGTIYLIKGVDVWSQLNKYSSLFYNFAAFGQTEDWSEVPLEFIANDVSQVSTASVGTYSVRGRLGEINDPNVVFKIVVIDPKLYVTDNNGVLNNKVYYDSLSVAVNTFGVRINGKEDEDGFLPNQLVQLEQSDGSGNVQIGYREFQIINRYWDISGKKVIFTCIYTFLDENDDIEKLAGSINGSQQLTFTVTVPLNTYLYTQIDESMVFNVGSSDGTNILRLTLGAELKMSDLPKAIMNKGRADQFEVSLLWDLSSINVNKAGNYNLYGYYRDYTSSYMAKSKNLVVVIERIDITNQISSMYPLNQTYTGLNIEVVPVLPDVLREQGGYSQLRLGRDVIVDYLTEEKYLLGEFGDFRSSPYKNAGVYYARITINDYNATGQQIYRLVINPIIIDPSDIIFEYGEGASPVSVQIPNWPETQQEKQRLYYTQFRVFANQSLGANVANRVRAAAYDTLFASVNEIGQQLLNDRYEAVLATNFPDYDISNESVKQGMRIAAKAIVWEEVVPTGIGETKFAPNWPSSQAAKEALVAQAKAQLDLDGESYTENIAIAQAYDNLYEIVMNLGKLLLENRLEHIITTRFPTYEEASDALKTAMMIEAKVIVWQEIILTGLESEPLINNWPVSLPAKETMLDAEYMLLLNLSYAGSEREFFIMQVKARAFDALMLNIYSTAQLKLQTSLDTILQLNYPLYNTYETAYKALILIEAKSIAWDSLMPGDTVSEQSYNYDGLDHLPIVTGLPRARIIGWPQTPDEKTALLSYAYNENVSFTEDDAKARAYDNLLETVYSNIYALQKLTAILNNIINENYPEYHSTTTSFAEKQALLTLAKARAWDTRIIPGDTVEEIYYTFTYWYADMNNVGMIISSRPRGAGTYEITLIIDPSINRNYRLKDDAIIITTINIRKAEIDLGFANEMEYRGTTINPVCNGLHDQNGSLPQGVTIEYSYIKDGQSVDFIRDVGQYTFSAIVNGGNNYPSWTVSSQVFNITRKDLTIDVGMVESGYLENLKQLNSQITFDGIVGSDLPSMFGYMVCESSVTSKHMVGEYPINFAGFKATFNTEKVYYLNAPIPADDVMTLNPVLFGNYNITVINGLYKIKKANENAVIINSQAELNMQYDALPEGSSVIWYVAPGSYDTLTINKNVGITLIGCYDVGAPVYNYSGFEDLHDAMMQKVKNDAMDIVTIFESIIVNRGAVTLDIIRINGRVNQSAIYVGPNATSVEVRRVALIHTEVTGAGGAPISQNASGITTSTSFRGLLRTDRIYIEGFTVGIYMHSGNDLQIINSRFNRNMAGVRSFSGNVHMEGSRFEFTRGNAVYLEMIDFTAISCSFISNEVAIKSLSTNTYDLWLENRFINNAKDIERL